MGRTKIDNRVAGDNEPCFIVAEIGINHNGDLEQAKEMIAVAKDCGVDGVKFQKFHAEDFISDSCQTYTYLSQGKEVTESMLEMFKRYEFSADQWQEIFDYSKSKDIVCFSTPQNPSDLDFLLEVTDVPAIKVGSDDLTNLELLEYYSSKNKPMIISAGMAFLSEIEDAVNVIRENNNNDLIVLHCVSSYPTEHGEVNLRKMLTIKQAFDVVVGFSDHTTDSVSAVAAVALGAKMIEKHFTLDKTLPGPDHCFSVDKGDLVELVQSIRSTEKAMGSDIVRPTHAEMEMRKIARRSIVAAKDIKKGEFITRDLICFKRPGTGLVPKFVKHILNRQAKANIAKDELISFDKIC